MSRERDFAARRAAIDAEEKALRWQPKTNHTDAEKIAAFDRLHAFAMDYVKTLKKNERFKDVKQHAFELLMEQTMANEPKGKDFWEFRNNVPYDWE